MEGPEIGAQYKRPMTFLVLKRTFLRRIRQRAGWWAVGYKYWPSSHGNDRGTLVEGLLIPRRGKQPTLMIDLLGHLFDFFYIKLF
jgi:hypothetical protein